MFACKINFRILFEIIFVEKRFFKLTFSVLKRERTQWKNFKQDKCIDRRIEISIDPCTEIA